MSNSKTLEAKNPKKYPLGIFEVGFYFLVWTCYCATSVFVAYRASKRLDRYLSPNLALSPYVEGYFYDTTDAEWYLHKRVLVKLISVFVLHSVVFRLSLPFYQTAPLTTRVGLVLFWILQTLYLISPQCLMLVGLHAFVIIVFVSFYRVELIAWISCVSFVVFANKYVFFSSEPALFYMEYTFYLYTTIQVLNVCIHICRDKKFSFDADFIILVLEYLLYPMYSMSLIVLLEDFKQQISKVRQDFGVEKNSDSTFIARIFRLLLPGLRLFFCFCFIEAFLHVMRATAVMSSPLIVLNSLGLYEVATLAYMAGQFFHMKYVIIFGIPSWFAHLDGMTPPRPPVCISRISKYSQMWRYFDRGLYAFLKNQVYIPFMGSATGWMLSLRRFLSMAMVFSFVLAWHGTQSNYVAWVLISALEIIMERIGYFIAQTKFWHRFVQKIGEANAFRLTAIAMNLTIIPSLLSVFFFLSQRDVGSEILQRLLIDGLEGIANGNIGFYAPGGFVLHMLFVGYFYNHCCLYLEYSRHPRDMKMI